MSDKIEMAEKLIVTLTDMIDTLTEHIKVEERLDELGGYCELILELTEQRKIVKEFLEKESK